MGRIASGPESSHLWSGGGEQHLLVSAAVTVLGVPSKEQAQSGFTLPQLWQLLPIPEKSTLTIHSHIQTNCLKKYRFWHLTASAPNLGSNAYEFCHPDLCSHELIEDKHVSLIPQERAFPWYQESLLTVFPECLELGTTHIADSLIHGHPSSKTVALSSRPFVPISQCLKPVLVITAMGTAMSTG